MKSNYPNQISALWTAFLLTLLFHVLNLVAYRWMINYRHEEQEERLFGR